MGIQKSDLLSQFDIDWLNNNEFPLIQLEKWRKLGIVFVVEIDESQLLGHIPCTLLPLLAFPKECQFHPLQVYSAPYSLGGYYSHRLPTGENAYTMAREDMGSILACSWTLH
jgi:hypothetical protein